MQAIDVVMLTKNSEHLLDKCIACIYQNVPVNNLIIVDGFSTDRTLKILDAANTRHGNVRVISMNGSRAKAREKGIAQVTTDWFLFVDSDVLLSKNWFRKAKECIEDGVGAVWGVNIDVIPSATAKSILRLQTLIASECFNLRGGTHDTLMRRDLVADIKIPEELHTYEDAYITKWIKDKGYKAVIGKDIFCLHYKPPANWNLRNAADGAILELKCGLVYSKNFRYIIYYPFFMFYWFLQIGLQNMKRLVTD
ncbi:MAG: glycosyltransferase family 2 protein [Candidatus Bathyarchaeota archaeon]|nr:glycosyltransferase family 2 protein [Candidatus Bathyarchaeota archaeon]